MPNSSLGHGVADRAPTGRGRAPSGTGSRMPDDPEPLAADHTSGSPSRSVMPSRARGLRPQHDGRHGGGGVVEERALGHRRRRPCRAGSARWPRRRCRRTASAGMRSVRRTVAPSTVRVAAADSTGPMRRIMSGAVTRQLGGVAEHALARLDLEQVGAELVELGQQVGPARRRDADDGHHGGDADGDAEGGEQGAHPLGPQPDGPDRHGVARRSRLRHRSGRRRCRAAGRPVRRRPGSSPGSASSRSPVTRPPVACRTRPGRRARRRTRGMPAATCWSWVMTTIVVPAACRASEQVEHLAPR